MLVGGSVVCCCGSAPGRQRAVLMKFQIILNFHGGDERVAHRATMGARLTSLDAPTARGGGGASRECWGVVPGCWRGVFFLVFI